MTNPLAHYFDKASRASRFYGDLPAEEICDSGLLLHGVDEHVSRNAEVAEKLLAACASGEIDLFAQQRILGLFERIHEQIRRRRDFAPLAEQFRDCMAHLRNHADDLFTRHDYEECNADSLLEYGDLGVSGIVRRALFMCRYMALREALKYYCEVRRHEVEPITPCGTLEILVRRPRNPTWADEWCGRYGAASVTATKDGQWRVEFTDWLPDFGWGWVGMHESAFKAIRPALEFAFQAEVYVYVDLAD